MRGNKKITVPIGDYISLGVKCKRPTSSLPLPGPAKKAKSDLIEVDPHDVVNRTEAALINGNRVLAESLVLSALRQILASLGASTCSSSGYRPTTSSSRVLSGFSTGLLILARTHPALFNRVAIIDQLLNILASNPRELGISLPLSAPTAFASRARVLHVLAANLLYFTLASQTKWPSHLVKVYLEDSLTDRLWVDQDECRLFVLNLETAFPKAYGNPRGLFTVLSHAITTQSSSSSGPINQIMAASNSVYCVLGLNGSLQGATEDLSAIKTTQDEIADAVSAVFQAQPTSVADVLFGPHFTSLIIPRFESSRQAIEVIVVNTLREVISRRTPSTNPPSAVPSSSTNTATSSGSTGLSTSNSGSGNSSSVVISGPGEATQLRSLIRTLAMAAGMPEIRSLVTTRLEPWLTNPKLQIFSVGLLALLATNCRLGGLSSHDLEFMVSLICRIRYKLLKPNIQTAFLECVCHMIKAAPSNLYTTVNLCTVWDLRPAQSTDASELKSQINQYVTQSVLRISNNVQTINSTNSSEDASSKILQQSQQHLNTATMAAVAANVAATINRAAGSAIHLLPFLYKRFSAQWIRVMGNLLHEKLITCAVSSCSVPLDGTALPDDRLLSELFTSLNPIYQLLRELARNWRVNSAEPFFSPSGSVATNMTHQYFPCAEIAGAILHDRTHRGNINVTCVASTIIESIIECSKSDVFRNGRIASFQLYIHGLVSLITVLQMISVYRPFLSNASRRTGQYYDALKIHQLVLRQVRLAFVRWAKTILPSVVNAAIKTIHTESGANISSSVISCFEALRPSLLIRRAFMLQSIHPLRHPESTQFELSSSCYPVHTVWANEPDLSFLSKLVMDVCLPEKLAHQLLNLGLEPSWQLLGPTDAVEIVCELVFQAASLAHESGLEALIVSKPEQLIDLMFACCIYVPDQQLSADITDLAHASLYWKVSFTAVILAANSVRTCGFHLWSNYPTIRRLMELAITNDFSVVGKSANPGEFSPGMIEYEDINLRMETQMILHLETALLNSNTGGCNTFVVTPESSKLVGRLVANKPRGCCRLPPKDQLNSFQTLCSKLNIGRNLWLSREPDFLLELISAQSSHVLVKPWLIRLVEHSGQDLDALPVQCLCEYLVYDTICHLRSAGRAVLPVLSDCLGQVRVNFTQMWQNRKSSTDDIFNREHNKHIVKRLREDMRTFGHLAAAHALATCFFARLRDNRSLVRQAVRQCLGVLLLQDSVPQPLANPLVGWLRVLQQIPLLPALRVDSPGEMLHINLDTEALQNLLKSVLSSIMTEMDLDVLAAYLIFICQLISDTKFSEWRLISLGLSDFVIKRKNILFHLLHRQSVLSDSSFATLEALSEVFVQYVNYNCTAAEAIPVDDNKCVFVTWSTQRQCPLELDCVQAQLLLLTQVHSDLPRIRGPEVVDLLIDTEQSQQTAEICSWLRLRNLWCISDSSEQMTFHLPILSPFASPVHGIPNFASHESLPLVFSNLAKNGSVSRVSLSNEIRCQFIQTNERPIVMSALFDCGPDDLLDITSKLKFRLLTQSTVEVMLQALSNVATSDDTSTTRYSISEAIRRLEQHLAKTTMINRPPTSVVPMRLPANNATVVIPAVRLRTLVPQHDGGFFWSQLVVELDSIMGDSTATDLISQAILIASCNHELNRIWLEQLSIEVLVLESATPVLKLGNVAEKSTFNSNSLQYVLSEFWSNIGENRSLVNRLEPLIRICASSEPEPRSIGPLLATKTEILTRCRSNAKQYLLRALSLIIQSYNMDRNKPVPSTQSSSLWSAQFDPTVVFRGCLLDSIRLFGLNELAHLILDRNTDSLVLSAKELTCRVVFCQPDLPMHQIDCGDYLILEMLNQSDSPFLIQCVRFLLSIHTDRSCVNCTRALDFVMGTLSLPRLSCAVPRSEPRDRPDSCTSFVELMKLTVDESIALLNCALLESMDRISTEKLTDIDMDSLDFCFLRRVPLLDLAITACPHECIRYLEQAIGFYKSDQKIAAQFDLRNRSACSITAHRLLMHVYFRWPGSANLFHTNALRFIRCLPAGTSSGQRFKTSCFIPHLEIDRIGPLLLTGLTSRNSALFNVACSASIALAFHHPQLFLCLLPSLVALSEGKLELNWSQFSTQKYHMLFSHILHLLEILSEPSSDHATLDDYQPALFSFEAFEFSDAINRLLMNLIHMLARFHTSSRRLNNYPNRLARLLESYMSQAHNSARYLFRTCSSTLEHLRLLSAVFDEFRCVLELALSYSRNSQSGPAISMPLCTFSLTKHTGKRSSLARLTAVVQQLQVCTNTQLLTQTLMDLDDVSHRRPELLFYLKGELGHLITHHDLSLSALATRLLAQLIKQSPRLISEVVQNYILPAMSTKLKYSDSLPVRPALLATLPDLCILRPCVAHRLLKSCAVGIMFDSVGQNRRLLIDSVEESVRRMTLDGFDEAGVEHATSYLIAKVNLTRDV